MELIPLGFVSSVVRDQVVVKIENPTKIPELGSRAYRKENQKLVGVVSDIIGPTREPYAVIKKAPNVSVDVGEEILCEVRRRRARP